MSFLLAQAADGSASPFAGITQMFPLIAIFFAIFYFMIIRPQQKQQKETQSFLGGLKKGDEVITTGGLIGRIDRVMDQVVFLELASNTKVRVVKSQIVGPFKEAAEPAKAPAAEDKK